MSKIIPIYSKDKIAIKCKTTNGYGYVINSKNIHMFVVARFFNSQVKVFSSKKEAFEFVSSFFKFDSKIFKTINIDEEVRHLTSIKNIDVLTDKSYCIISHIDNRVNEKMYIKRDFNKNALYSEKNPIGSAIFLDDEANIVLAFVEKNKPDYYSQYKVEIL